MRIKKNSVTITLIASSISLLLVLQGLWLRSSYQEEHQRIEKEARLLFRNLIFDMSDSLIQKSIHILPSQHMRKRIDILSDSLEIFTRRPYPPPNFDSVKQSSNVQVFVYAQSEKDSIKDYLKPLVRKIRSNEAKSFSISLNGESLAKKDVEKNFTQALTKADLPISFEVKSVQRDSGFPLKVPRLMDDEVIITPMGGFQPKLTDIRWFVLKRISPQIFFSFFLTALTIISFVVLFRSIRTQQRLAELKNDFISNMTHELKTPVTTVGVAIEALQNFNGLENKDLTKEYLTIAQNELGRLSLLTDKILKTAIFENKGVDFQPETVNLEKIIEQTISSMKLVFDKQKALVSFEKTGSNFQLLGSQVHLTNVVYNLLDNALKYSTENPIIKISLTETGKEIILSVQDNGIGISPEFKKKVFEKFFRVPTGNLHNSKGYGLGLSYVDSVVKVHGGTIKVESNIGVGSTFIITLPSRHSSSKI